METCSLMHEVSPVRFHVLPAVGGRFEGFLAVGTHVGPYVAVGGHVAPQAAAGGEGGVTRQALEGFEARVCANVSFQHAGRSEALAALQALIRPLACVGPATHRKLPRHTSAHTLTPSSSF